MGRTPPLFRIIPTSLRRRAKSSLRPYAERFFEAYLEDYQRTHRTGGMHPKLASSATHLPVVQRKSDKPGEPWGYMLPKADPDAPRWSDGLPIPPKSLWHGYAPTIERVMAIGEKNVRQMTAILREAGCQPRPGWRALDFGCAAGFMTRQLKHLAEAPGGEVWGVDLSGAHVDWCMRHLSPPFRFALTSSFPSLPFEDGRFDLAFGGSVFSHIGEQCDGWLLELARVLRPGGTLYLTLVTKQAMWKYIERWPRVGFSIGIQRAFSRAELESDFATLAFSNGPGLHTVYDLEYFKSKCEGSFEVLRVEPDVYTFQWAVALRKKGEQRAGPTPEVVAKSVGSVSRL